LGVGWPELLEGSPELAPLAAEYRHAQGLVGGSPEVPAGVRRAWEQPRKLANELAYLERALESQPERADLRARVLSLRARLSEEDRLEAGRREEVRERLEQVTAEACLAAAEQQVLG
jgi:hypothetical protein